MKLFAFTPWGFGAPSFFVAAEDEVAARTAVERHMVEDEIDGVSASGRWPERYTLEVFEPGRVATNGND